MYDLKKYLPTTRKELNLRGWDDVDVILFSGDAYIDHPSFGAAVIGRVLEDAGYRVAIVPQPDWRGDGRDFTKLGRPRLFFAVTAGSMDSMVNHYTAAKRLRSDDAYTPEGRSGARPDYCTQTYCNILKRLYPDVPIVIGGIEASMRRLTHYDYWSDSVKPSILVDSQADILIYGMGERPIRALADAMHRQWQEHGRVVSMPRDIAQTAYWDKQWCKEKEGEDAYILLHGYDEVVKDKVKYAENFKKIEIESNRTVSNKLIEPIGGGAIVVNSTGECMRDEELDEVYALPFQYFPHPKYKGKRIPAYEMIRFSVCMHRGCFGGCSFCTISAHQGKHIVSRSKQSILNQIKKLCTLPEWKGYLSDLGGPSANMYGMHGVDRGLCDRCVRASCLYPKICKNLNKDFAPLLDVYRSVDSLPEVKKAFVGSGVRYDLMSEAYGKQLIVRHVSGRLKVAPEHTEDHVLDLMRKPKWSEYLKFRDFFMRVNESHGLNQQIIPYFISSHPGCTLRDMKSLSREMQKVHYHPEQVQDFTPTPMTLSTCMYYTGLNPYTMQPVYVAKDKLSKQEQNSCFFWWKQDTKVKTMNRNKKRYE